MMQCLKFSILVSQSQSKIYCESFHCLLFYTSVKKAEMVINLFYFCETKFQIAVSFSIL
jgi:hypothetical protein